MVIEIVSRLVVGRTESSKRGSSPWCWDQICRSSEDLQPQLLCSSFSLPHHWMHLACSQSWSTTLLEEMEHYVFCGRLSSNHSGFTIPTTMAVYTQHCIICHSAVYVCWGRGHYTRWLKASHHPHPHFSATLKAPIYSTHLKKSWCSHNSGLNECWMLWTAVECCCSWQSWGSDAHLCRFVSRWMEWCWGGRWREGARG